MKAAGSTSANEHLFGSLTAADVAGLDRVSAELGIHVSVLMEIAGWQVARCAWRLLGDAPGQVAVLAGSGNNGGDGVVAGRHLRSWGCEVRVRVLSSATPAGILSDQLAIGGAEGMTISVHDEGGEATEDLESFDLVIDALLGTGLRSAPRPLHAAAIPRLSAARAVLSVDVPSGLDATSGEAFEPSVQATASITLAGVKSGLWSPAARALCGELFAAAIGIPLAAWERCGLRFPAALRGGDVVPVPAL